LVQHIRHFQMVLEVGKRLLGPILQFSVVAPFGITFEEGDRAFVSADLHRIVFAPEIGWSGGVQLVDLFLRRAVGRRWQGGLNVAARNKSFQLIAGLGVTRTRAPRAGHSTSTRRGKERKPPGTPQIGEIAHSQQFVVVLPKAAYVAASRARRDPQTKGASIPYQFNRGSAKCQERKNANRKGETLRWRQKTGSTRPGVF
jgi:hypothetical protein